GEGVTDAGAAAFFGEKGLIVVAAVHGAVVEERANSAEADETKTVAVIDGTRSEKREAGPAAVVDGQIGDGFFVDYVGEILRGRVDDGNFCGDFDGGAGGSDAKLGRDFGDAANLDDYLLRPIRRETGSFNRYCVCCWSELADTKISCVVRGRG